MEAANTCVVIAEGNGKLSDGFDTIENLDDIPDGYNGYVWTNRIDRIGSSQ